MKLRRGDLWRGYFPNIELPCDAPENIAAEDLNKTHRYKGLRPFLLLSPEEAEGSPSWFVAPISSAPRGPQAFLQPIDIDRPSIIHYEQGQSLDTKFLLERIGRLSLKEYLAIDIHLPVPMGLTKSSFMHIVDVSILGRETNVDPSKTVFTCKISRVYSDDILFFTQQDFLEHFGSKNIKLLNSSFLVLSNFLKTLEGLKFLHYRECVDEYEKE